MVVFDSDLCCLAPACLGFEASASATTSASHGGGLPPSGGVGRRGGGGQERSGRRLGVSVTNPVGGGGVSRRRHGPRRGWYLQGPVRPQSLWGRRAPKRGRGGGRCLEMVREAPPPPTALLPCVRYWTPDMGQYVYLDPKTTAAEVYVCLSNDNEENFMTLYQTPGTNTSGSIWWFEVLPATSPPTFTTGPAVQGLPLLVELSSNESASWSTQLKLDVLPSCESPTGVCPRVGDRARARVGGGGGGRYKVADGPERRARPCAHIACPTARPRTRLHDRRPSGTLS